MKKIMFMAAAILLLAACKKEGAKITLPISNDLQSDPDRHPTTKCGSALTYGTMTYLGKVHGISVSKTCTYNDAGTQLTISSDDITYAADGTELWTKGHIVINFPTDGSTTATITGGSAIVGGTGRFAGATGYFIYENMVYDLVTGHESHKSHGQITFTK